MIESGVDENTKKSIIEAREEKEREKEEKEKEEDKSKVEGE